MFHHEASAFTAHLCKPQERALTIPSRVHYWLMVVVEFDFGQMVLDTYTQVLEVVAVAETYCPK